MSSKNKNMKLKICGMKYAANIQDVAKLRPDYMGFIFYSRSKRFAGRTLQASIVKALPSSIKRVGVFVNSPFAHVLRIVRKFGLDLVQLHGNESPEYCERISKYVPVIKAFGVDEDFDFTSIESYSKFCKFFLFDTKTKTYGGSGKTFNWKVLQRHTGATPYFLSGGIGVEEIGKIKEATWNKKPMAIDVNSRVEVRPGMKNGNMLQRLKSEI